MRPIPPVPPITRYLPAVMIYRNSSLLFANRIRTRANVSKCTGDLTRMPRHRTRIRMCSFVGERHVLQQEKWQHGKHSWLLSHFSGRTCASTQNPVCDRNFCLGVRQSITTPFHVLEICARITCRRWDGGLLANGLVTDNALSTTEIKQRLQLEMRDLRILNHEATTGIITGITEFRPYQEP